MEWALHVSSLCLNFNDNYEAQRNFTSNYEKQTGKKVIGKSKGRRLTNI